MVWVCKCAHYSCVELLLFFNSNYSPSWKTRQSLRTAKKLYLISDIYPSTIFLLWLKLQHRWRWRPIFQRQHNPNPLKGKDGGAEEERELVWGRLGSRRNSGFPVMMKRKRILVMMIDNLSRRREAYYWWGEGGRRRDSRRQPLEPKPEHFM